VWLSVVGAVPYGTSKDFWKAAPHSTADDFRPFIHQIMAHVAKVQTPMVMVADRSGIHRAKALAPTLDHDQGQFRLELLPARAGHKLNSFQCCYDICTTTRVLLTSPLRKPFTVKSEGPWPIT